MRFTGVSARVFPLRANMYRLRAFCEDYLNVAPEIVRFEPAFPYVYLMIIDYGKMAAEIANVGWVSQREVAFAVPLEWYDMQDGGRMVDLAAVCPFIYVDDETSLSTGRQVFGWPKAKVWASHEVNPWIEDPLAAHKLLTLSTMVYPELYAGQRQEPRVLLEVLERDLSPFSRFPIDPNRAPHPLSVLPDVVQAYLGLWGSFFEMMMRPPMLGYHQSRVQPMETLLRAGNAGLAALSANPSLNNITLKQFRDSAQPDLLCYQALINSKIRVERLNQGGPLGDRTILMGDPSGGYEIMVHQYAAQPIVESLGLEISREIRLKDRSAAVLKPVLPYWLDLDLTYGAGEQICWRTRQSQWFFGENRAELQSEDEFALAEDIEGDGHRFNTARGSALQGIAGPFDFPNVTMRVLPLLADERKLAELCATYLENSEFEFEAWGRYVYLIVTNYEDTSSKTNNIGWWTNRQMGFYIPVKVCRRGDPANGPTTLGVVCVFAFTTSTTAAISVSEVLGQPTQRALIGSPEDKWMHDSGPAYETEQSLLTCSTSVLPAIGLGQKSEIRTLIQVKQADRLPDVHDRLAATWGQRLLEEHRRMIAKDRAHPQAVLDARALSLEILANERPINQFSLKQFRDVAEPDLACYQAIVNTRRSADRIQNIQEIEDLIHVYVHQQPNQPIVDMLGLSVKWSGVTADGRVDVLQPLRPFWVNLALSEQLGENVCWRSGSTSWRRDPNALLGSVSKHPGYLDDPSSIGVGRAVLAGLGTRDDDYERSGRKRRQHLQGHLRTWARDEGRQRGERGERLSLEQAREAIANVEPQQIVEGILSAEWEHWGRPRWYMKLNESLEVQIKTDHCVRTDSVGDVERIRVRENKSRVFHSGWTTTDGRWYSEDERAAALGWKEASRSWES